MEQIRGKYAWRESKKEEDGNHEARPRKDDESAVSTYSTLLEVLHLLTNVSQAKPFCSFPK